ncbi:hypothetical protein LguiB_028198 [Lonicera macranthoides]
MDSSEFGIGGRQTPATGEEEKRGRLVNNRSTVGGGGGGGNQRTNFMGKHRMAAAIAHLNQQIQIIQEELDQLETLGESSIVCKELVSSIESNPDALLPVTRGPAEVGWDRWFQGAHSSRNRKRWI